MSSQTKTIDDVKLMRAALQAELDRLPPVNAFGESNDNDIALLREWIAAVDKLLADLEAKNTIVIVCEAVQSWYQGDDIYFLEDCL